MVCSLIRRPYTCSVAEKSVRICIFFGGEWINVVYFN